MQRTFRFPNRGIHPFRTAALAILSGLFLACTVSARTVETSQPSPGGFALSDPLQFPPNNVDVIGFRLSLAYGHHHNVMGLDLGALVSAADGDVLGLEISGLVNTVGSSSGTIQIAGIANNCYEDFCGCQVSGIANRAGGMMQGGQIGCFNMAGDMSGIQIGVYNKAANASGLQIGVFNETTTMQGIQIGLLNIQHEGPTPFFPILNLHF